MVTQFGLKTLRVTVTWAPLAVEPADSHVNGLNGRRPAHACRASTPDQQKQGKRQQESTFLKRIHHDFSMA